MRKWRSWSVTSVPVRKFVTFGSAALRTSEPMRTLANHCFLVWFMVPKSATVADPQYGGLRNHHTRVRSSAVGPTSDVNRPLKQRQLDPDAFNLKLSGSSLLLCIAAVLAALPVRPAAAQGSGTALVVGIDDKHGDAKTTCTQAVASVGTRLREQGIAVQSLINPSGVALRSAIDDLAAALDGAAPAITVIYICAPAVADTSRLFVMPSDSGPQDEANLAAQGVVVPAFLNALAGTGGTVFADLSLRDPAGMNELVQAQGGRIPVGLHLAVSLSRRGGEALIGRGLASKQVSVGQGWNAIAAILAGGVAPQGVFLPKPALGAAADGQPTAGPPPASHPPAEPLPPAAPPPEPPPAPMAAQPTNPAAPAQQPPAKAPQALAVPPTPQAPTAHDDVPSSPPAAEVLKLPPPPPPEAAPEPAAQPTPPRVASLNHPPQPPAVRPSAPAEARPARPPSPEHDAPQVEQTPDVRIGRLQVALTRRNLYRGPIDGRVNATMQQSIRLFQHSLQAPETGALTHAQIVWLLNE